MVSAWMPVQEVRAQTAVSCPVKIGGILPLTGSMGPVGKRISDSAQLAVKHINDGGGVKGCPVQFILRDDQGQPTVGVDAAKYLVEVERVPAITGSVSSGVTLPILTSVTVPSKVPVISCCSTGRDLHDACARRKNRWLLLSHVAHCKNPSLRLGQGGGGSRLQARHHDLYQHRFRHRHGEGLHQSVRQARRPSVKTVAYNENQPSYRAEVNSALSDKPDAVFLVAFPQDGATMTREWISLGGTQNLILNNALRTPEYVKAVGGRFLQNAFGMDNASTSGPTVEAFKQSFQTAYNASPDGPGIYNQYDAVMILGLAMNIAPDLSGTAIRDAIRKLQAPDATMVGTGPEEFKKAVALIKDGKAIRYSGATGPLEFDPNGDVSGAALIWNVKGDQLGTDQTLTVEEMSKLIKQIDG